MEIDEANKIVAEFMGLEYHREGDCAGWIRNDRFLQFPYSMSFDSLVPVWEKLEFLDIKIFWASDGYRFWIKNNREVFSGRKTIQEAACVATAKAILALTQESEE